MTKNTIYYDGKDGTLKKYGDNQGTRKGIQGEDIWESFATQQYDWVKRHTDKESQYAGFDFEFKKKTWRRSYTADVKSNMNHKGEFFIDVRSTGWLLSKYKRCDRIVHLCVDTLKACQYDRVLMANYVRENVDINDSFIRKGLFNGFLMPFSIAKGLRLFAEKFQVYKMKNIEYKSREPFGSGLEPLRIEQDYSCD